MSKLSRREIIGGELLVTPAPGRRHQRAVAELISLLLHYAKEHEPLLPLVTSNSEPVPP